MTDTPFFTVVMATYDRGRHILPSVRSVLAQDWPDFELIVVGDGCTDETEAILRALPDSRLRWMNLPQRMGSQTWPNNAGIAAARGSHIAYLGHDDLWEPDHLSRLAAVYMAGGDVAFVASGCALHNPKGLPGPFITGLYPEPGAERVHFAPPSSFSHLRSVIDRIGPWRDPETIRPPVDSDLLLRAVEAGLTFATTGAITVHKFAAGHRYLSYLWHDTVEQDAVLARLSQPGIAEWHAELIAASKAAEMYMTIRFPDFSLYEPGQIVRENAARKGVRLAHDRLTTGVMVRPGPMEWSNDWTQQPDRGIRWSIGNARPRVLLPVSGDRAVLVAEFAHASPEALSHVAGQANGEDLRFRMSPPIQQMGRWIAMGRAEVTLRQDRPTALELSLDGVQAPVPGVAGLGHGRLVLLPFADPADQQAGQRLNAEGTTRHPQGDVDGAVADFRAALAKSPLDTTARGNLALLLTGEAAVDEALICIGLDPNLLPGWMVLARAAMVTGAFGVARRIGEILDGLPGGGPVAANLRAALPA